MTSTHTTEPTTGETYTTLATRFAIAVNTAELDLVAFLTTIPANTRQATALAVRRRTPREAHRYTHAADLAEGIADAAARERGHGRDEAGSGQDGHRHFPGSRGAVPPAGGERR